MHCLTCPEKKSKLPLFSSSFFLLLFSSDRLGSAWVTTFSVPITTLGTSNGNQIIPLLFFLPSYASYEICMCITQSQVRNGCERVSCVFFFSPLCCDRGCVVIELSKLSETEREKFLLPSVHSLTHTHTNGHWYILGIWGKISLVLFQLGLSYVYATFPTFLKRRWLKSRCWVKNKLSRPYNIKECPRYSTPSAIHESI